MVNPRGTRTRPAGGGKNALPDPGTRIDLVYGAPHRVAAQPWPRTKTQVAATADALHTRMREELGAGLALTGQTLPGPIPAPDHAAAQESS